MNTTQLQSWLALSHLPGMRSQLFNKLLKHFKDPQSVLDCGKQELRAVGINANLITALQYFQRHSKKQSQDKIIAKVEASLNWQAHKDQHIITRACDDYPELLRYIPDSPPLLYVKGDLEKISLPQIAMVGSRNPGPGGRKNARSFARDLTQAGFIVCSGLALGIDSESHQGALSCQGSTLAVLGAGIDNIYPKQNQRLAEQIVENGALISEFALGLPPIPRNFPQRNRIISGLSQGVLVVEAALRSGSLITARFALEQGREVFAIPGSIHNATARGCHHLISNGAKLVQTVNDILEELGALLTLAKESQPKHSTVKPSMSTEAALVLAAIDYDVTGLDALLASTAMEISRLGGQLMELELRGLIKAVPGGYILS